MTENPEGTAGTPTQEGGDAAATPTAGTPEPEGRNAPEDERWKEALQWKAKAERVNEVEARLAEMEARQTPAADADTDDPVIGHVNDAYAVINEARSKGQPPPRWALHDVAQFERQKQLEEVVTVLFESAPEDNKAALKLYASNPGYYRTPKLAAEAIKAKQLAAQVEALQAEMAKKDAEYKRATANRVDPHTVTTDTREGASSVSKTQEMTRAEWDQRINSFDESPEGAAQRMALKRQLNNGKIAIRG